MCGDVRLPAEMGLETPDRGWRPLHDDGDTRWVADDAFLFGPSIRGQSASDFGLRSSAQLDGVPAPSLPDNRLGRSALSSETQWDHAKGENYGFLQKKSVLV